MIMGIFYLACWLINAAIDYDVVKLALCIELVVEIISLLLYGSRTTGIFTINTKKSMHPEFKNIYNDYQIDDMEETEED